MSHYHELEDGFPNLEELDNHSEDHGSAYSVGAPPSVRECKLQLWIDLSVKK